MGIAVTEGAAESVVDTPAESSAVPSTGDSVATVDQLRVTFRRNGRDVHALRGVSLQIAPGEILGLVGESGSGKSVLGFSMLGLLPKQTQIDGTVTVAGSDMVSGDAKALRKVRRLDLGAVFQDPMTSLNPTMRIGKQVAEAAGSDEEALRLLTAVGIPEPKRRMGAYPHELSGGLRQRVMIAMAIAGDPELIIADEPTTALDVTVQAQVLRLLRSLRDELGCSIVFITHDLGVAAQISDRIAVLYAGRIAEVGPTAAVLGTPAHPYTHGLLRSRLTLQTARDRKLAALAGSVPSAVSPLPGCAFEPRCTVATDDCTVSPPDPVAVAPNRTSACLLRLNEVATKLGAKTTNTEEPFPETADEGPELPHQWCSATSPRRSRSPSGGWTDPRIAANFMRCGVFHCASHMASRWRWSVRAALASRRCCVRSQVWKRRLPARSSWSKASDPRWCSRTRVPR